MKTVDTPREMFSRRVTLAKSIGVATGSGFLGSSSFLPVMVQFPDNPFAAAANTLLGISQTPGIHIQPLGWLIHASLVTVWAALFGLVGYKVNLQRIYVGAVGWALAAWLWGLTIWVAFGLLSTAAVMIELALYLTYGLVLAAGYSYGVWGTIEARVRS